jgi:O-antigen ligase
MTPGISAARQPESGSGFLQKIGFVALAGFVYVFTSRLLDVSGGLSHLHLPLVLAIVASAAAVLTGRILGGIKNRIVFWYAVLTGFFMAGLPFSFWRGGSFQVLREDWAHAMLVVLLVTALTTTFGECKALLNAIALASFTAAVLGLFFQGGATAEGRLVLVGGRFSNPNDYALVLLIGLPFIWRMYDGGGRPGLVRRLAALGIGVVTVIGLVKTGSRTGLYAVLFAAVLILLRVPPVAKVRLALFGIVVVLIALLLMPSYLRSRYLTFATADQEAATSQTERTAVGFAANSTRGREILLRESLALTLRHPVFGVGLGNFAAYLAQTSADEDVRSNAWLGTHNTYTQLSSEAGIPALAIFIVILVSSWRSLTRVIRATREDPRPLALDIHRTAHAMQICLGSFACSMMFFHFAYDMLPHLLVVLTLVLSRTSEAALAEIGPAPPEAPVAAFATRPAVQARSARATPGR